MTQYSRTSTTCHLNYVGQTYRRLKQRFSEHIRYIQYKYPQSPFDNHIVQHAYEFGPIQNTVPLLRRASKERLMGILEQFFIRKYNREHTYTDSGTTTRQKQPFFPSAL